MLTIRPGTAQDVPAVTAIYGHHVLRSTATFETVPPAEAEMAQRRSDVLARGLPYLVAEREGQLAGFAYCQWFKPRPAYRFSAEDSIYLHPDAVGQGAGRQLLQQLVQAAEAAGIRKLIAVIGDSGNAASIGLHRTLGFEPAGVIRSCGWKFGRWLDIVLMEKALGDGDRSPPRDGAA